MCRLKFQRKEKCACVCVCLFLFYGIMVEGILYWFPCVGICFGFIRKLFLVDITALCCPMILCDMRLSASWIAYWYVPLWRPSLSLLNAPICCVCCTILEWLFEISVSNQLFVCDLSKIHEDAQVSQLLYCLYQVTFSWIYSFGFVVAASVNLRWMCQQWRLHAVINVCTLEIYARFGFLFRLHRAMCNTLEPVSASTTFIAVYACL